MVRQSSHSTLGLVALSAVAGFAVLAGFAGCSGKSGDKGVVSGTVAYQENMALPADASVKVELSDVSKADAAAPVIAETTLTTAGQQVPVPFELSYSSDTIDPQHRYAVSASIESDGKTLYATDTSYPVITGGNANNVSLMLVSTGEVADSSGGTATLAGTEWKLADLAGDAVVTDSKASLAFSDDGKVSGNGTCNRFSGPVMIEGAAIHFGALAATKMACLDAAANAQEVKYFTALRDAEGFKVDGTTLTISVKGMDAPLRFTRTKPAP